MGHYFSEYDANRIVETIDKIEETTDGEVRVHIEDLCDLFPIDRAIEVFDALKMSNTEDRTGVLIYLAVDDKKIAIIGDEGINQRVKNSYWDDIIDDTLPYLKNMEIANAIIFALNKIGKELSKHFPATQKNKNELTNEISYGKG